jgi:ABC-type nickel/cobalt efflux system permease component RcnA
MGNFSISHYAAIQVAATEIEIRYLVDMAEIPTFQEIQDSGITTQTGSPRIEEYLTRKAESLGDNLHLAVDGERLALAASARDVLFSEGAGGLATMKLRFVYRARLGAATRQGWHRVDYRDGNFADRAGWKEIVAVPGSGITLASSSAPERDRSRQLSDYPTDMLNSPPQVLEAQLVFGAEAPSATAVTAGPTPAALAPSPKEPSRPGAGSKSAAPPAQTRSSEPDLARASRIAPAADHTDVEPATVPTALQLTPNRQATRGDAFTRLIGVEQTGFGVFFFAALVAATLGAFHALEPGHGKTVVAAYLVGSRGTARHALLLGLIVTASHTLGVYLLGGVTLYASRYVVPERLYPWLAVISGLTIAVLGVVLFLRRWLGIEGHHQHGHDHHHGHHHRHEHDHHEHDHHHHPTHGGAVSLRELFALGITGGIIPCPAALVVLLSAVALHRVGFGLFLIAAFSLGLAAVLIAIGILMVSAANVMARFRTESPLITRWLPLTSSAVIGILGMAIAVQALLSAGIVQIRLG